MAESPVLSFPAVLRNPGLVSHFAQVQAAANEHAYVAKPSRKVQCEGKRWVRRKDNAEFVGNPHIVAATRHDYTLQLPYARSTFPEPLPPYLPRVVKVPSAQIPRLDPVSANAGRFSLSLKGMRKALRRSGNRAEVLVRDIEHQLVEWLWEGGTLLNPDSAVPVTDTDIQDLVRRATPIGDLITVLEVKRTPLQLIWYIADDAFARYVLHCCARYHEVVSYSKEVAGYRLTHLIRPNVTRPDHRAPTTLDTPPVTDIDYSSHPDSETDFLSDISERAVDSDVDTGLGVIAEADPAADVDHSADTAGSGNTQGDSLSDAADSASELGYVTIELSSLNVGSPQFVTVDLEQGGLDSASQSIPQHPARYGQSVSARRRIWDRSTSSPSRSPSKTKPSRRAATRRCYEAPRATVAALGTAKPQTLYDYLYS